MKYSSYKEQKQSQKSQPFKLFSNLKQYMIFHKEHSEYNGANLYRIDSLHKTELRKDTKQAGICTAPSIIIIAHL